MKKKLRIPLILAGSLALFCLGFLLAGMTIPRSFQSLPHKNCLTAPGAESPERAEPTKIYLGLSLSPAPGRRAGDLRNVGLHPRMYRLLGRQAPLASQGLRGALGRLCPHLP